MKSTVLAFLDCPSKGCDIGVELSNQATIIIAKVTRKSPAFAVAPK